MPGKTIDARAVIKGSVVFVALMSAYFLLGLVVTTTVKYFGVKSAGLSTVLTLSDRLLWIASVMVPGWVAGRTAGKYFFLHGALVGLIGGVISMLFLHFWSSATGEPGTAARSLVEPALTLRLVGTVVLCGFAGMAGERRDTRMTPVSKPPQAAEPAKPTQSTQAGEEEALHHSGLDLYHQAQIASGEEAKVLYQAACEKFLAASVLNASNPKIMTDWGAALMAQAALETGEDGEKLYEQAKEKFLAAEALQPGIASYNLACIHSRRGEYEDCRKRLESARDHGNLPALSHIQNDPDLANVHELQWFKNFIKTLGAG